MKNIFTLFFLMYSFVESFSQSYTNTKQIRFFAITTAGDTAATVANSGRMWYDGSTHEHRVNINGTNYSLSNSSSGSSDSLNWGLLKGDITDQTDLQIELNSKLTGLLSQYQVAVKDSPTNTLIGFEDLTFVDSVALSIGNGSDTGICINYVDNNINSWDQTNTFTLQGTDGDSSSVHGKYIIIKGGDAHTTGNNNSGGVIITNGLKNGTGKNGGVTLTADTVSINSDLLYINGSAGTDGQLIENVSGVPTWTTPSAGSGTYSLIGAITPNFTPVDATTYYFGIKQAANSTSADVNRVYIPIAGTINTASINIQTTAANGTNESFTVYIRKNNTTDYAIATLAVSQENRFFLGTSLGISVSAGDYIEWKIVCPTWGTNPNGCIITATAIIDY